MDDKHKGRVEESIHQMIAELLIRRVKDPRVKFVSITGVKVSKDYSVAKILYNVVGAAGASSVRRSRRNFACG